MARDQDLHFRPDADECEFAAAKGCAPIVKVRLF
jgi:hypothetical protein